MAYEVHPCQPIDRNVAGPTTATLSFYDDNGAPINLSVGGQKQSQVTVTVPALGVAQIQTDGIGPLQTGWARVQSDQSLSGIALFASYDGSGNFAGEVGDSASIPLRAMSLFAQSGNSTSTGIALANPNTSASSVTLTLRDSNSNPIATSTLTIPPMGHLAKYIAEIFSGVPLGEFEGKMDVVSTLPLATITLRQRGSVFTALPVIP